MFLSSDILPLKINFLFDWRRMRRYLCHHQKQKKPKTIAMLCESIGLTKPLSSFGRRERGMNEFLGSIGEIDVRLLRDEKKKMFITSWNLARQLAKGHLTSATPRSLLKCGTGGEK